MTEIEQTKEFKDAFNKMENSNKTLFITGKAGSGKSTLLKYYRTHSRKKVITLAPTGVAALNINGQTIHSFFKFKPDITPDRVVKYNKKNKKIYRKVETIIIDEISMVRSDLLDCIDKFLRINRENDETFGGVQMIFIGDLYQLPPVVNRREIELFKNKYKSQYFFDANVIKEIDIEVIELKKIYRQRDDKFISILNAIRNNNITDNELEKLNKQVDQFHTKIDNDFYIYLTTTNKISDRINQTEMKKLDGKTFRYNGYIEGDFDNKSLPTEKRLELKVGAQIMLLNNESSGKWVNGSIGKIDELNEEYIKITLSNGQKIIVTPHSWEIYKIFYDEKNDKLESEILGSFTQYPLKLAWAITIHKSQGKTFENVVLDIGNGTFCHGQLYVALSRCKSLEGLKLKRRIQKRDIILDDKIVEWYSKL